MREKEIYITINLTSEEINLLLNTDWTKEIKWDEKYNSLITKGVLYEDYALNLFLTYGFSEIGNSVMDELREYRRQHRPVVPHKEPPQEVYKSR
jgi:hypothetical protein